MSRLKQLARLLRDEVTSKFAAGVTLHDVDIRNIALRINTQKTHVDGFKASGQWIQNFKRHAGICSRKITTFITKRNYRDQALVRASADDFVNDVKEELKSVSLSKVCNADQSGFLKELHTPRSLAPVGVKKVERIVQAVSATTHSYTIMPIVFADGHLADKLYIQLQEPNGRFPQRGHFRASNLYVTAGTSHIMTKQHLLDWVKNCVFEPSGQQSIYMIVDSWSSFTDHGSMQSVVPAGNQLEIRNIPPGATSLVQPLDLYFFRPFKQMVKRFTSHVQANDIPFVLYKRDNILKMISLVYGQFACGRFQRFLQYPWFAAGYLNQHPGKFETPLQFCFPLSLKSTCEDAVCTEPPFIRCAKCELEYCFDHFVISFHQC